jgi:hypothetical protein
MSLPLTLDATFIASLSWTGKTRLRVEEIAPNEAAATASADSIESILSLIRAAQVAAPTGTADHETRALLDSTQIEHHNNRVVLTATIPIALLQRLVSAPVNFENAPANSTQGKK